MITRYLLVNSTLHNVTVSLCLRSQATFSDSRYAVPHNYGTQRNMSWGVSLGWVARPGGLLFVYAQSHCEHWWVEDPTLAVFWLDTRAVLTTDPWQPGTELPRSRPYTVTA